MLASKCVTLAEVGAQWHNGGDSIPLLHLSIPLALSVTPTTTAQMKPGHAPGEQQNRQLPLVGLEGPDLKKKIGEIDLTQKQL